MNRFPACLLVLLILSAISCVATEQNVAVDVTDRYGAVVKRDSVGKTVYFVFTADSVFEGAPKILDVLKKHNATGSFFLTGNCLRMKEHEFTVKRIIKEGHYLGGHSNCHLLYADWDEKRTNLVSDDSLRRDLQANYEELARFGITQENAPYFLPPYEWYNAQNISAIREFGVIPVNFTPRIGTSDDYTFPDMGEKYRSSQQLIDMLFDYEQVNTLDGAIILIHPGTSPRRTDKLYNRMDEILTRLQSLGYTFFRL